MTLEVVMLTPLVIIVLCLVVLVGRSESVRAELGELAHLTARAASTARTADDADARAHNLLDDMIRRDGSLCPNAQLAVDTSHFQPGGSVTVGVSCTFDLADLAIVDVPGHRTFTAAQTSVVDYYRSGP